MFTFYKNIFNFLRALKAGFFFDYIIKSSVYKIGYIILSKFSLQFSEKFFIEYFFFKFKKFSNTAGKLLTFTNTNRAFWTLIFFGFFVVIYLFLLTNELTSFIVFL